MRRDFVKGQRRKQAQDCFRHPFCHLRVGVALRDRRVWQSIDPAPGPAELSLAVEAQQVFARNADGLDVAGPHDSVLADILHGSLNWLCSGHCVNPSLFNHL